MLWSRRFKRYWVKTLRWMMRLEMFKKLWDCQVLPNLNWTLNWTNIVNRLLWITKSQRLTKLKCKSSWPKTHHLEIKCVGLNKILDFLQAQLPSLIINWKLLAIKMNNLSEDCKMLELLTRRFQNMKISFLLFHRKLNDWMPLLIRKILRSRSWKKEKSKLKQCPGSWSHLVNS